MKKQLASALVAVALLAVIVPSVAAATTLTARMGSYGVATIRVGSPDKLSISAKNFRPRIAYTITLRRGSCATAGTLVYSTRLTSSSTGTIVRTLYLTSAQTRAAKLPLAIRISTKCAAFAAPVAPTPTPVAEPTPTPTPTPLPVSGSARSNPIPLGQIARAGDWLIGVTGVYPDAWPMIQAANMFNDPPAVGQQFFMIAVTATYTGAGSDHLDPGFRMSAVGGLNVGYTTFDNHCGVLPEPNLYMHDPEVFSGGMVSGNAACWEIASSDAPSLVMYDQPFLSNTTVWFALR